MTRTYKTEESDHAHIWHLMDDDIRQGGEDGGLDTVIFYVVPATLRQGTSVFSLEAVVRQYCQARIQGPTTKGSKASTCRVTTGQLYDVLGLLRALQYDVEQFNKAIVGNDKDHDKTTTTKMSSNERKYACFRLIQQAQSLGVRLQPPWIAPNDKEEQEAPSSSLSSSSSSPPPRAKVVEIPGLDALLQFLELEFASRLVHAAQTLEQGVVDFDSLGEYYRPGVELLDLGLLSGLPMSHHSTTTTAPLLVKCRASHYTRGKSATGKTISNFQAACECVVAIGPNQFTTIEARLYHYEFKGTRRIRNTGNGVAGSSLSGEMLVEATDTILLQQLEARGRIYEQICDNPASSSSSSSTGDNSGRSSNNSSGVLVHYSAGSFWPVRATFAGQGVAAAAINSQQSRTGGGGGGGQQVSRTGGRLMVDTVQAWMRGIHPAKAPADGVAGDAVAEAFKNAAHVQRQREQIQWQQRRGETSNITNTTSSTSTSDGNNNNNNYDEEDWNENLLLLRSPLPDHLVRRTWPVVCGFSLELRSWGLALVDGVQPVQFQEQAFDDLVLPPARKRLLRALITSHGQREAGGGSGTVDALPGKGEGIIFLLHGPPGVGKTLTAEAVSEVLHRPLYRVSMGELGTTPESLEARLLDIFELCLPWQALVLIDEAEMLLEKRTHSGSDLVRNAMVCVMLRLMEYYPGILFLTTNSGKESLDPAVASRLTCTLAYHALSLDGRREVWKTTLRRVEPATAATTTRCRGADATVGISDADLDYLAQQYPEINGRQIKNAVQLAWALCRYEKTTLELSHLEEMLEMTNVTQTNNAASTTS